MNIRFLSPTSVFHFIRRTVSRHLFSTCWLLAFTVWVIFSILIDEEVGELTFCLWEGFMLSISIGIWTRYLRKNKLTLPLQFAAIFLVACNFLFFILNGGFDNSGSSVGQASLMTALAVACFFVPANRNLDVRQVRTVTYSQIRNFGLAAGIGIVLCIAWCIVISTIETLFADIDFHIIHIIFILIGVVVPAFVFVGNQLSVSRVRVIRPMAFGGRFCKFVLLPLTVIYMLILYIYMVKIIVTTSLPNGEITWMVTTQMTAMLLTLYGLYDFNVNPAASTANIRISSIARRWLPILMLPLLVLMTVGVAYRLAEYGITASRLYVSVFLIWAYVVDIYLIIKWNKPNLNAVVLSFAVVFVAVSVIPGLNIISISNCVIRSHVKAAFRGHELPLTVEQASEILKQMPEGEAQNIASKIAYLDSYDDHTQIADIVKSESMIYVSDFHLTSSYQNPYDYYRYAGEITLPDGFTKMSNGTEDLSEFNIDAELLYNSYKEKSESQIMCFSADSTQVAVIQRARIHQDSSTKKPKASEVYGYIFTR